MPERHLSDTNSFHDISRVTIEAKMVPIVVNHGAQRPNI